jgi:hypothetical protein
VRVVTLLSDLGRHSAELAALRGRILSMPPGLKFVDMDHDAHPYDLLGTAFMVRGYYPHFPPGTLHVISVNMFGDEPQHVLAAYGDQWFLAPDNGIIPMLLEPNRPQAFRFRVPIPVPPALLRDLYLPAIARLEENGFRPDDYFIPYSNPQARTWEKPQRVEEDLRISILFNDAKGNAHTNIDRRFYVTEMENNPWRIHLGAGTWLSHIAGPGGAEPGQAYLGWNEAGMLYIGMVNGDAVRYLGLRAGRHLLMEFK